MYLDLVFDIPFIFIAFKTYQFLYFKAFYWLQFSYFRTLFQTASVL